MLSFLLAAFLASQAPQVQPAVRVPSGDGCNTCLVEPTTGLAYCTLLYCGPVPTIAPVHPNPQERRIYATYGDGKDRLFTTLLVSFLSAQAADTALTLHQRARYGYVERNPILTNRTAGIVLTKAAITAGGATLAWKWRRKHPKVSRLILIVGTTSATAATLYNARRRRP